MREQLINRGDKRDALNAALQGNGFESLDNPRDLLDQIAGFIDDHEDFRNLLAATEESQRMNAYLSLRSRLPFEPKPLADYEAEIKNRASEKESHHNRPLIEEVAEDAIRHNESKGTLQMVCHKCLKREFFFGKNKAEAIKAAREKGWVYSLPAGSPILRRVAAYLAKQADTEAVALVAKIGRELDNEGREICRRCPAVRPN